MPQTAGRLQALSLSPPRTATVLSFCFRVPYLLQQEQPPGPPIAQQLLQLQDYWALGVQGLLVFALPSSTGGCRMALGGWQQGTR